MSDARTALIGDIHGNFVALDAVLSDSERRGVDGVVCHGRLTRGRIPADIVYGARKMEAR